MNLPNPINQNKVSREDELKARLQELNFDPLSVLIEATKAAEELINRDGLDAISIVQRGSKMILDELKEARKSETDKKSPTYLMIPSGFDADGNAIFENRLLDG